MNTLKSSTPKVSADVPKLEDFDYDEDKFFDARIAHEVGKATARSATEQKEAAVSRNRDKVSQEFSRKVAASNISGYSETINNLVLSVNLTSEMLDVIMDDDKGPEIAHHLGTNLDKADALTRMTPLKAAKELGKISANLSGKKIKNPSNAPDPVKTAGKGSGTGNKNYDKMSMQELYDSD